MLGPPRFGLVAVMLKLSLLAGPFPHPAIAENPGWVPTGGGEDWGPIGADNFTRYDAAPVSNNKASGASGPVQCYICTGGDNSECHKFPEKVEKEECPGGYCFHQLEESSNGWAMARRGCANLDLNCNNQDKPGRCTILPNTVDEEVSLKFAGHSGCFSGANTGKWTGKGTYEAVNCVCGSDLCNALTNVSSVREGLKCYFCSSFDSPDCYKSPEKSEMVYCPSGYCYQDLQESSAGNGARVRRGCASEDHIECLKNSSELCSVLTDAGPGGIEAEKFATLQECFKAQPDPLRFPDSVGGEARSGEGSTTYTVATCVCQSELCNVRLAAKDSASGLGAGLIWIVAGVALLMASTK